MSVKGQKEFQQVKKRKKIKIIQEQTKMHLSKFLEDPELSIELD
jgi:hypothetical protein